MDEPDKSQSSAHPECYRAAGFTHGKRVVDEIEVHLFRFSVDGGKFIEIAMSDALALSLRHELGETNGPPSSAHPSFEVCRAAPRKYRSEQDVQRIVEGAFQAFEEDESLTFQGCANQFELSTQLLRRQMRRIDPARYNALGFSVGTALRKRKKGSST
ncbi:MAG: hypothetical protein AAF065_11985 [Verrucomicrobiota bacterium]